MQQKKYKDDANREVHSIRLNADFIKELLIPLATFVENIEDLEKIFEELALILNMNHINLYRIHEDGTYSLVCQYSDHPFVIEDNLVRRNVNLHIASSLMRVSSIPMPKFGDNIVVPVGIDDLYLSAGDSKVSREIAKIENHLFELVAGVVANTLRSMRLIEQANTDKLTQLLNRNALDKYIYEGKNPFDRELSMPIAVCMLDIDHFKRFNDTFGHNVGDKVLRHVADVCKEYFGDWNKVYRFGGEEITFVIHDYDGNNIAKYIDGVRKKIADTPLIYEDITYSVKASVGVYKFDKKDYLTKDSKFFALKYADQALYKAKEGGRNRTEVFDGNED